MSADLILRAICVGAPQTMHDAEGTWRSAIYRQPVAGPIELGARGLAGDQVADTHYHGSPEQAVCCLPGVHHAYWAAHYGREFGPGAFGENWVLDGGDERTICIGDVYAVGTAEVQVTQPRVPCWKQSRKLGIPDLHKEIAAALRTGFYVRVLTPGVVAAGDALRLLARPRPEHSLEQLNAAFHRDDADAALLAALAAVPELAPGWRARFRKRAGRTGA